MRPRVLLVAAAGIALAVAAYAVLSPSGLPQLWKLSDQEKALTAEVKKARADNAALADEVKVLQGGQPQSAAVLEKRAREELGYVRSDEVVLTVGARASSSSSSSSPPTSPSPSSSSSSSSSSSARAAPAPAPVSPQ